MHIFRPIVSIIAAAALGGSLYAGYSKWCTIPMGDGLVVVVPINNKSFIITVKTDNPGTSTSTEFTIPTDCSFSYNYNVDCDSDGNDEATGVTGDYTCSYDTAGTYKVTIKDNAGDLSGFPAIYFNDTGDKEKLLGINQWGKLKWKTMAWAFTGCKNLNGTGGWATDAPDLSQVTSMYNMFNGASTFNQSLENWDTSNITQMNGVFSNATAFNQPIGSWDTRNVTDMGYMFYYASNFNQPIENWDTRNVTNMYCMFSIASEFNQPIGSWNTGNVTNMGDMFSYATSFNQPLYEPVTFHNTTFLVPWDTRKVTNMNSMFEDATSFQGSEYGIEKFNTSSVTNMDRVFFNASSFSNHDLGDWNVSSVTSHQDFLDGAGSGNTEPIWP